MSSRHVPSNRKVRSETCDVSLVVPEKVRLGHMVDACCLTALIAQGCMSSHSQPYFIAEQAIEVHKSFCGIIRSPSTKFLLHFARIHRSSPVPLLPLHQQTAES